MPPAQTPNPPASGAALALEQAVVSAQVVPGATYLVHTSGAEMDANVGALLPELLPGDLVLVATHVRPDGASAATIVAVLAPLAGSPLTKRALELHSEQQLTLRCGESRFTLTAEGLASLLAHEIHQSARDLVDIDGAEVRIN